jgi:YcxB-like protein
MGAVRGARGGVVHSAEQSPDNSLVRAPPTAAAPGSPDYLINILLPVIPWLLIFGFIWFFVIRQIRKSGVAGAPPESTLYEPGKEPPLPFRSRDPEAKSTTAWAILVLMLAGGAVAVFLIYALRSGGSRAWPDLLLPMFPWLAIILFLWFFLFRRGGGLKALWDAQPALHRPHVVEVYTDRIVFTDAVDRLEHKWEAFTHVRETPGVFLLFTSTYSMHIIPKRVFPSRADIDAFRELIRRTIAQRPAPAFPVLPAGGASMRLSIRLPPL